MLTGKPENIRLPGGTPISPALCWWRPANGAEIK
uniref:Uncharacterized protein n=1 Tax=Podoviridae sp. ctc5632 TaxID=2826565 RepID=A0A8S5LVC7_9CAUD|nr:MAG TPA: hypothetical protein [Podoviridae sp. ctc5632]